MYKSKGLIETHFHGAFGIDFMDCSTDDIVDLSVKMPEFGITRIYPTLMTGDLSLIKHQIKKIKEAQKKQPKNSAAISGIHLEGPFINSQKKGIHQEKFILKPTVENYQKIEDEFIKIVTIAPEIDENHELLQYLKSRDIKVQAGHTLCKDIKGCDSVTHFFNAMGSLTHREQNIISSTLTDDEVFLEIIADGNHVVDDVLKMVFRTKPKEKVVLISDALPITHNNSRITTFAGQKVELKNGSFYNAEGTLAGSGMLVSDILKRLVTQNILSFEEAAYRMTSTPSNYMKIENNANVLFDENLNPVQITFIE